MAFLKKGDDSGCKILSIIKTEELDEDAKEAVKAKLNAEQDKDAKKLEKK